MSSSSQSDLQSSIAETIPSPSSPITLPLPDLDNFDFFVNDNFPSTALSDFSSEVDTPSVPATPQPVSTCQIQARSKSKKQQITTSTSPIMADPSFSESMQQILVAMQKQSEALQLQNTLMREQLDAEKDARRSEQEASSTERQALVEARRLEQEREKTAREAWEKEQRDQWAREQKLREDLQTLQLKQAEKLEGDRLLREEKIRQQKAALQIAPMGLREDVLCYFDRLETSFNSLGIDVDAHKIDALRTGLRDEFRDTLTNVSKSGDISYETAKTQVLLNSGFSSHLNILHFSLLGPSANEPSRWFKEKVFRMLSLYSSSPLETKHEAAVVEQVVSNICISMLTCTLTPEAIDKVLSPKNKTITQVFNAFSLYVSEHPYALKRPRYNNRYDKYNYDHSDKRSHDKFVDKRSNSKPDYNKTDSVKQDNDTKSSVSNPSKPSNKSEDSGSPPKSPITCGYCNKRGHTTEQCFTRKRHEKEKSNGNKSSVGRVHSQENLHSVTKPVQTFTLNKPTTPFSICGLFFDKEVKVRIDTGADITVVPMSVVPQDTPVLGTTVIASYNNITTTANVIMGTIEVMGIKKDYPMAVSLDIRDPCILLGTDFGLPDLMSVLTYAAKLPQVQVVTRKMAAETRVNEELARQTELDQQATATPPDLVLPHVTSEAEVDSSEVEVDSPDVDGEDLQADSTLPEVCNGEVVDLPLATNGGICRDTWIKSQETCPSLSNCRHWANDNEKGYFYHENLLLFNPQLDSDNVLHNSVIVVPKEFIPVVLRAGHDQSGHLGRSKTKAIISRSFTWPGITVDVREYVNSCQTCQLNSKQSPPKAPLTVTETFSIPFERIAFDLVGPFPKSRKNGYRYILTAICMGSHYCWAIPLRNIRAEDVIDGMLSVFKDSQFPREILTDRGTQFVSLVTKQFCAMFNISQLKTSAYRPQSNGMLERMHATLVSIIKKSCVSRVDWPNQLDLAIFALRNMPHRDHGYTPCELVFGRRMPHVVRYLYDILKEDKLEGVNVSQYMDDLCERLDLIRADMKAKLSEAKSIQRDKEDSKSLRSFNVGDQVLFRTPGLTAKLDSSWEGPYQVIKKIGILNYQIKMTKDGKQHKKVVHINHIKPFNEELAICNRVVVLTEEQEPKCILNQPDLTEEQKLELDGALNEYTHVFSDELGDTTLNPAHIDTTTDDPIFVPPYKIPIGLEDQVRAELQALLDQGIIERSEATWGFPLIPVRKKDGGIRLVVDYRKLNQVTVTLPFYMPTITEITDKLGNAKYFSKIDLTKGFYQIPLDINSRDKTTFISPMGKFRFTRLPFGLKNAPATFQCCMITSMLTSLCDFASSYIDDIIIFSNAWSDHIAHIKSVLSLLNDNNLTVKPSKCTWGATSIDFLGKTINNNSISIPHARIQALQSYIKPCTQKQLRSLLGLVNFYRAFLPSLANYTKSLTSVLSHSHPSTIVWSPCMNNDFSSILDLISSHSSLTIPNSDDTFSISSDASSKGVGGVLYVCRSGQDLPVAFYSRQTKPREEKFSASELECLALVETVDHFKSYLIGRRFKAFTDHRALKGLLSSTSLNSRLWRWVIKLMEFDMEICYRRGSDNVIPDALSRQGWPDRPPLECKDALLPQSSISFEERPLSPSVGGGVVNDLQTQVTPH